LRPVSATLLVMFGGVERRAKELRFP
jgi:hypothetical protein